VQPWREKGGDEMSTLSHPPTHVVDERPRLSVQLLSREPLVVLAIVVMWLAVAVTAVWGGDIISVSSGGSNSTTLPSVAAVALFAFLGSWVGFKHGFTHPRND
jgi:hypothetical protein